MEEKMAFDLAHCVFAPFVAPVAPTRAYFSIAEETPADVYAREKLLDEAFGPARLLKACERLREGRAPARGLALVAKDDERLVATLRLWPIFAGAGRPALLLGPLAVARDYRSLGSGAAIVMPGPVERERFLALELAPGALAGAHGGVMAAGEKAARVDAPAALACAA
jgi:predicted N-acetyltransferase YhbS